MTEAPPVQDDRSAYAGVLRYYELAKRAEWQVRDLPWGEMPPIPEYKGAPKKLARRRDMWRSVKFRVGKSMKDTVLPKK